MIQIQKAKKEDVRAIQEVFYKAWLDTYPGKTPGVTLEDVEEWFRERFSDERIQRRLSQIEDISGNVLFLVAKDEAVVVGLCKLEKEKDRNRLGAIYILPAYHRKGIGLMFWEKALEYFEQGKDIVVHVDESNTRAIMFYRKMGFVDAGKRFSEEKLRMPISGTLIVEMEMIINNWK